MRAPYLIVLTYYASYPLSLIYDKALVWILIIHQVSWSTFDTRYQCFGSQGYNTFSLHAWLKEKGSEKSESSASK